MSVGLFIPKEDWRSGGFPSKEIIPFGMNFI